MGVEIARLCQQLVKREQQEPWRGSGLNGDSSPWMPAQVIIAHDRGLSALAIATGEEREMEAVDHWTRAGGDERRAVLKGFWTPV